MLLIVEELDEELLNVQRLAQQGRLEAVRGESAQSVTTGLMNAARQVGSNLAQLVSAATSQDR